MKPILTFLIRVYQFFSRLTPRRCRFYPTCSEYAVQSVHKYGWLKGSFRALGRLLRCHPYHPGGFDPVT
jgi:uncharacterized protein